jgi:hypothetical protein
MDVLVLIDRLHDLVRSAKRVPLRDQVRVDKQKLYDILDQMRSTIPEEIKQARWIVKERQGILAEAEREAERIVKEARERQTQLVSGHELIRQAERAREDIDDARAREREIRAGAEDYADEILGTLELNLAKFIAAVQRGRERLQGGQARRGRLIPQRLSRTDPIAAGHARPVSSAQLAAELGLPEGAVKPHASLVAPPSSDHARPRDGARRRLDALDAAIAGRRLATLRSPLAPRRTGRRSPPRADPCGARPRSDAPARRRQRGSRSAAVGIAGATRPRSRRNGAPRGRPAAVPERAPAPKFVMGSVSGAGESSSRPGRRVSRRLRFRAGGTAVAGAGSHATGVGWARPARVRAASACSSRSSAAGSRSTSGSALGSA